MQRKNVRLTTDVVPKKYEIALKPDLEAFVFEGEETIHLTVKKPTRAITLHCAEIEIESAEIVATNKRFAKKISYDEEAETVTFLFSEPLPKGLVRLRLTFRGVLNDRMRGFYRSSYEHQGKQKHLATTQFESTDARRAFPCFDEPAMKAVFEVSLIVPSEKTAISNTVPIDIREHSEGYRLVRFAPTPLMSTYLLAFIVGDFEHVEKKSRDGVLVRVFTTPGKKHQAKFALECAANIITFYNAYFNIPYPMPTLDLIAIPDFSAGAMENWGAITYRESALLVDSEHSSIMNKQWVALVIAHELAHQWFGNLVTMEWWTHLWLNEGFASFIEYLAVDHVFPSWDIWTQFLYADFGRALQSDGLLHTHPIEVDVHHPSEIAEVFDAVSYSKGASIIRMLAEYLGEKTFRDGLRLYLKKHRLGNTATRDLWKALEQVSGKPVERMMANWTSKAGYPLIEISEGSDTYLLKQSRFFASPLSQRKTRDVTLWSVPVNFDTGNRATPKPVLMTRRSIEVKKKGDAWVKLNANESGFYRTNYTEELLEKVAGSVASKRLKTRDRLGLIRDVMALSETGKTSTVDGLRFARHYLKETEYVVWTEVSLGLGKVHSLLSPGSLKERYQRFALDVFGNVKKNMTWNTKPKDHAQALLKVLVLENLGRYGDRTVITQAQKMFAAVTVHRNRIPPDLRGIVYYIVAKYGGPKEYEKLMRLYSNSSLHEEKNRIGRSLAAFPQKHLLERTLAFAISKHVRPQDSVGIIAGVTVNPAGRDLAWRFIKKNWKTFQARYAGGRELSHLIGAMSSSASLRDAKDIETFMGKHPTPGTERGQRQVLERIRSNAAWIARDRKELETFLPR